MNRSLRCIRVLAVTGLAVASAGCSDQSKSSGKALIVKGVAQSIDPQTKRVSMTVTQDDGSTHELSGFLSDNVEVFINGRAQAIKDVQPGDKVRATVKRGESEDKFVVVRVEVERPQESEWKPAADNQPSASKEPPATSNPPMANNPPPANGNPPAGMDSHPTNVPVSATDHPMDNSATASTETPHADASGLPLDRQGAEDMIYSLFRIRMEESIEKRRAMLEGGTDRSDPEVRKLEGIIMKAQSYLAEHGEMVEQPEPPIVERAGS